MPNEEAEPETLQLRCKTCGDIMTRVCAWRIPGEDALEEGWICGCTAAAIVRREGADINQPKSIQSPRLKLAPKKNMLHAMIQLHLDARGGRRRSRKGS